MFQFFHSTIKSQVDLLSGRRRSGAGKVAHVKGQHKKSNWFLEDYQLLFRNDWYRRAGKKTSWKEVKGFHSSKHESLDSQRQVKVTEVGLTVTLLVPIS